MFRSVQVCLGILDVALLPGIGRSRFANPNNLLREADKEVVPLLVQLWKTDRDEVRRAAFEALKQIAPAEILTGRR